MALDISVGQLVESKQGRDKGRLYFVIEVIDDNYLKIVDGRYRKLNNPKLKKNKHLIVYKYKNNDIIEKLDSETLDDISIKKILKSLSRD
ncbi:MAG: KOW domain-containing RNA-binding protein [Andreesenia angusta]|nr:KOW domain-containing RNA-binding protein [Andreesenia angusta]